MGTLSKSSVPWIGGAAGYSPSLPTGEIVEYGRGSGWRDLENGTEAGCAAIKGGTVKITVRAQGKTAA